MVLGTVLNLNPLFEPLLFPMDYYGLAQRFVVFTFYLYFAFIALKSLKFSNLKAMPLS